MPTPTSCMGVGTCQVPCSFIWAETTGRRLDLGVQYYFVLMRLFALFSLSSASSGRGPAASWSLACTPRPVQVFGDGATVVVGGVGDPTWSASSGYSAGGLAEDSVAGALSVVVVFHNKQSYASICP